MLQFKLKDGFEKEAVEHVHQCAEIASNRGVDPPLRLLALVQAAAAVAKLEGDDNYGDFLIGRALAIEAHLEAYDQHARKTKRH